MTEPCSTGIGGDMFILFWDADAGQVRALNGSGRAGGRCTLERIRADLGIGDDDEGFGAVPLSSVHAVTVPGAAAGWVDTVERFGSGAVSLVEVLAPAIALGEKGFPVSEETAYHVRGAAGHRFVFVSPLFFFLLPLFCHPFCSSFVICSPPLATPSLCLATTACPHPSYPPSC